MKTVLCKIDNVMRRQYKMEKKNQMKRIFIVLIQGFEIQGSITYIALSILMTIPLTN